MSQTFGSLLRQLRKRQGMTQDELANRLGYSRSLVAALELNQRQPDVDSVANTFIPALDLVASPELAAQLVELAAFARHKKLPAALSVERQRRSIPVDATQAPQRIPVAPTRLLGREREIEVACNHFLEQDVRLLTLVGPPGVGKTRLAQAVASRLQGFFADRACFVPLAGVSSPDFVATSILTALELSHSSRVSPLARLVADLRHKEMLLLLDNFEQILDAAPQVAQLLAECAGVRVLVTSRERLHLRAEHIMRVSPLPLTWAVDLFMQRARAVDASLELSEANRGTIQSICQRLDCLPLAIELCAAQADFFSPAQLLERVQLRPLDTVADSVADLPPRHHSLRAAIQVSYDLLDADERALLRDLSVFAGGCDPDIVAEVCPGEPISPARSLDDLLRALAAKNLVRIETTAEGGRRLMLLESVREFAGERLRLEGDPQALRARHFDAYLRFARLACAWGFGPEATIWDKRLDLEHDNVRLALQWAADAGRFMELAWLIVAIQFHWRRRGMLEEASDWVEKLLPHCDALNADLHVAIKITYGNTAVSLQRRAKLKATLKDLRYLADACEEPLMACNVWHWFAMLTPDAHIAADAYRRAIELARRGLNKPEAFETYGGIVAPEVQLAHRLRCYARFLIERGETVEPTAIASESLNLFRAVGHEWGVALVIGELGGVALLHGETEQARASFQEAVDMGIHLDDLSVLSHWQPSLGLATLYAGDVETAHRLLIDSLEPCRAYGDPANQARAYCYLADAELWRRNVEEAKRWLAQSLTYDTEFLSGTVFEMQRVLLGARLAAATDKDLHAAHLFGAAHALGSHIHYAAQDPMVGLAESSTAEVRARLGECAFEAAYAAGEQWTLPEAHARIVADVSPR